MTNTFNNFEQVQSGFTTDLAAGAPAEDLAVPYNDVSRATYDAQVAIYQQLDGSSMQFADALSPVTGPAAQLISGFEFGLGLDFTAPDSPATDALDAGDLPLSAEALDSAIATILLNGDSLPGL